jgi:ABC-type polysaccharide/polyol phosphate transport system ATPase subunit
MSAMIEVSHITMDFRMDRNRTTNLKEYVVNLLTGKRRVEMFHALDDVTFSVPRGSVTGLIGPNGAGKSTILKVISGIYRPTSGSVQVGGQIVPMLELGSGFDADLSGRENILLNGAILGYSRDFLMDRMDEIIRYSELGDFIHMPLKTYSSGMLARLAFSIAAVVEPDVLIVDEILSVGDEHFQRKSRARMMEMMTGGATVLFVSHNLSQLRQMCDRVIWLDHGRIRMDGDPDTVLDLYAAEADRKDEA